MRGLDTTRAELAAALVPTEFYGVDAWTIVDGAEAALRVTRTAGFRNVILSNHAPELPTLVEALGLGDLIDETITSATVGAEKPNRIIFDYAMKSNGISEVQDVWMVGDNPIADVRGAQELGIRAILADGAYPDSTGMSVLEAARTITHTDTGSA